MTDTSKTYKTTDTEWLNEAGQAIPYTRTTKSERIMERNSARILKAALSLNGKLIAFKELIKELSTQAYDALMDEKNVSNKTRKNFTWYNFDRSIKIEINVNEPIQFDDLTITAAKAKLDEFLEGTIQSKNQFAKQMAISAFQTQRSGKLDVKKVMDLTRYERKVNDPLFTEAVELINQAIRRPKSKTYFRVWLKDENGEYNNVELNLSNV